MTDAKIAALESTVATLQVNLTSLINAAVADTKELKGSVDTFYLLYSGALVFFMQARVDRRPHVITRLTHVPRVLATRHVCVRQAGFGVLEAGSVRVKNTRNILLKNLLDACAPRPSAHTENTRCVSPPFSLPAPRVKRAGASARSSGGHGATAPRTTRRMATATRSSGCPARPTAPWAGCSGTSLRAAPTLPVGGSNVRHTPEICSSSFPPRCHNLQAPLPTHTSTHFPLAFEDVFAATGATIVSGAMAERAQLGEARSRASLLQTNHLC